MLKRMSNPRSASPCRAQRVCRAVYLSTYAGETLSSNVVQPVKSKKGRSRAAGAVLPFSRFHVRPRPSSEFACARQSGGGACPQQTRGFPAGTPSVHAAAHTALTATPPMSRSCERRPARCAMLTRIPRQRFVKDRSQSGSLNFSALSPTCPRRLHHFMSVNTCAAGALASEHCPHTPT
jgi:hypothetical protein